MRGIFLAQCLDAPVVGRILLSCSRLMKALKFICLVSCGVGNPAYFCCTESCHSDRHFHGVTVLQSLSAAQNAAQEHNVRAASEHE